ncbi:hypothetical protein HDU81_001618 [Chytriomyces hyalinus]|nr:hypothetical protein HDU81_001618 [Chytriomyces hyalinus]
MQPNTTAQQQPILLPEPAAVRSLPSSLPSPPMARPMRNTFAGPGGIELLDITPPESPELVERPPLSQLMLSSVHDSLKNVDKCGSSSEETLVSADCEADEVQTSKTACRRGLYPKQGVYKCTAEGCDKATASLANAINIKRMGHLNHHFSKQELDNVSGCRYAASFDGSPSCQQVADLNNMSLRAFQAINRNLDCSTGSLPDGALVCIGVGGAGGVVPNVKPLPTFDTDSESDSNNTATMTAIASGTAKATSVVASSVSGSSATLVRTVSTATTTESVEKTSVPITTSDAIKTKDSPAPSTLSEEPPAPSPSPEPSPEPSPVDVPAPSPTQQPAKDTGDACGYIISLANSYGGSSSPSDAVRLHNEIRAYVSSVKGISLSPLSWSDAVASQATADAIWSVGNSNCAGGALAHSPEWSNGVHAKSLGWSNFMFAIQQFVSYDDGGGSECAQWFANPGMMSHFGNIVSDSSSMGCGLATCPGGQFGPVVGCDYA